MSRLLAWFRLQVWRWQTVVAVGVFLMGVSSAIGALGVLLDEENEHANDAADRAALAAARAQIARLSDELECRSQAATEASNISSEISVEIAAGLVDVARGREEELLLRADHIEQLIADLQPALERRAEAVEACANGGG